MENDENWNIKSYLSAIVNYTIQYIHDLAPESSHLRHISSNTSLNLPSPATMVPVQYKAEAEGDLLKLMASLMSPESIANNESLNLKYLS